MRAAWIIAMKDLRQLLRDRMALFFALGFPLLVAMLFGTIFGGSSRPAGEDEASRIAIVLVDEDQTDGSHRFAKTLREASELRVVDGLDRAAALDAVRTGKQPACVVMPKGFGQSRESMFWGGGTRIELAVDPARRAEAGMLEGLLTKYGFQQMQEGFTNPDLMREQVRSSMQAMRASDLPPEQRGVFERFFGDLDTFLTDMPRAEAASGPGTSGEPASSAGPGGFQPINIEKLPLVKSEPASRPRGPSNSYAITFPQGVVWGVMGCAMGFSIGLVLERTRGTMIRLRAAPLSRAQILGGKGLACLLATAAVSTLVMIVGIAAFGVRPNSYPLLVLAIACVAVCFVGIMMLMSVLGGSERGGSGLGWGVLLVMSMIGGGMIPLFLMPGWMQSVSIISPIRWSILALEGAIWRGFSPAEMLLPCGVLLAIGLVGFALGARFVGRTEG